MTAQIVTLFHETPLQFVQKSGPKLTAQIACRFCWTLAGAMKAMRALEEAGLVTCRKVVFREPLSAALEWTATALPPQAPAVPQ